MGASIPPFASSSTLERVCVCVVRNRFVKYEDFNQTDDREEERTTETVAMRAMKNKWSLRGLSTLSRKPAYIQIITRSRGEVPRRAGGSTGGKWGAVVSESVSFVVDTRFPSVPVSSVSISGKFFEKKRNFIRSNIIWNCALWYE